jgi:hypothetical protein
MYLVQALKFDSALYMHTGSTAIYCATWLQKLYFGAVHLDEGSHFQNCIDVPEISFYAFDTLFISTITERKHFLQNVAKPVPSDI